MAGVVVIAGTAFLFTLLALDVGDIDEPSSIQRWLGRLTDAAAQDPWLWYGGGGALMALTFAALSVGSARLERRPPSGPFR